MARSMGGCIAVAICSALLHSDLRRDLPAFLNEEQTMLIDMSLANLRILQPEQVEKVRRIFGDSYNNQFRVMIAFAGANIIVTALLVYVARVKEPTGIQGTQAQAPGSAGSGVLDVKADMSDEERPADGDDRESRENLGREKSETVSGTK